MQQTRPDVVRPWTWKKALPQFVVQSILILVGVLLWWPSYQFFSISLAEIIYLTYSYGSRAVLLRSHKLGMNLTRQGKMHEAIDAFEKSYQFFSKNVWLDEYRAWTMLTPILPTYREAALINMAYCFAQLGDKAQTEAAFRRVLAEYPNNAMAQAAIKELQDMEDEV